jgi:hypothetical protein
MIRSAVRLKRKGKEFQQREAEHTSTAAVRFAGVGWKRYGATWLSPAATFCRQPHPSIGDGMVWALAKRL